MSPRRRALATLLSLVLVLLGVGQLPASGAGEVVTGYELRMRAPLPGEAEIRTTGPDGVQALRLRPVYQDVRPQRIAAVPGEYVVEFGGDYLTQRVSVTIVAGSFTPVVVELAPDIGIAGRLLLADDGAPVAQEPVHIQTPNWGGSTIVTAADGTYSFWGLDPGTYTVSLPVRGELTPMEVVVANDATTTLPDLGLERLTHISVSVDLKVPGALIDLSLYRVVDGLPQPEALVPDGPSSRFTVEPGTYLLVVHDSNHQLVAPVKRILTVARGENVAVPVQMSVGSPVTGSVVDSTYRPVTWGVRVHGIEVSCATGQPVGAPAARDVWTTSRPDGTFSLPATPGSCYDVTPRWSGQEGGVTARRVAAGTARVVLRDRAASQITLSAQGAPYGTPVVLRAYVRAYSATGKADLVAVGGTVTFRDDDRLLGTATVSSRGVASLTVRGLKIGPHDISAFYSGTAATYQDMTSSQVWVSKAYPTTTVSATNVRLGYGATVVVVVSGPCTPTGTVTVTWNSKPVGTVAVKRVRGGYAAVMTTARLRTVGGMGVEYSGNWCMHPGGGLTRYEIW